MEKSHLLGKNDGGYAYNSALVIKEERNIHQIGSITAAAIINSTINEIISAAFFLKVIPLYGLIFIDTSLICYPPRSRSMI